MVDWFDTEEYDWVGLPELSWHFELDASGFILNQISTDLNYVYAATTFGLNIIDLDLEEKIAYSYNDGGFNSLWVSEEKIYLGTNNDGIKYLEKSDISGTPVSLVDLSSNIFDCSFSYPLSSTNIIYLHGVSEILSVVTNSGIDIFKIGENGFKSTTICSGVTKCFLTSNYELYYIVQNTSNSGVFRVNNILCDWQSPDASYIQGDSFLPLYVSLTDLCTTVDTSSNSEENTLFVATSSGVFILDEGTDESNAYYV